MSGCVLIAPVPPLWSWRPPLRFLAPRGRPSLHDSGPCAHADAFRSTRPLCESAVDGKRRSAGGPMLLLDTTAVPSADHVDAFRAAMGQASVPCRIDHLEPDGIRARMHLWAFGGSDLFSADVSGFRLTRTPRHVRMEAPPVVALAVQAHGSGAVHPVRPRPARRAPRSDAQRPDRPVRVLLDRRRRFARLPDHVRPARAPGRRGAPGQRPAGRQPAARPRPGAPAPVVPDGRRARDRPGGGRPGDGDDGTGPRAARLGRPGRAVQPAAPWPTPS